MSAIIDNPFAITGYISPEYFCDRENETAELVGNITNGRNTALISERRMGKTGLIEHVFHRPEIADNYHAILVDIYPAGSLKEFVFLLSKQIFESLKPQGRKFIDRFFATITSLHAAFKLDPVTGAPTFDISLGEIRQPETSLEQIFQYLENADKRCVVAIDEFQQIARFSEKNVEALLRTHIQRCRNTNFIFAGSINHMMHDIFFTISRPFYQSVSPMTLGPIEEGKYVDFVMKFFKNSNMDITPDEVDSVYRLFGGHTWYMQRVFNEIYSRSSRRDPVYNNIPVSALDNVVWSYEPVYKNIMANLPERQKEILIAIAKEGRNAEITSAEFIGRHGLKSASSIQSSVRQLMAKDIISKDAKSYSIPDRFFALWLQMAYGPGAFLKEFSTTLIPRA
ncbi:MAG: ATPase [Alistipes sp.]|jgi:AAA+ ATPase superfamily predicted ATPase|nr:ATPase [Alistipes sp.]